MWLHTDDFILKLLVLLVTLGAAIANEALPRFDLKQPYIVGGTQNQNYLIGGSTILSRKGVKLTGDIQDQHGWLTTPSTVLLPENFRIEVDFRIDGESKMMYGDGMAFWLLNSDQPINEGSVFGLSDYFKGTAVFVDTYRNHRPGKMFPMVMLMQGDGTQPYDLENDGKANELASCSAKGLYNTMTKTMSQMHLEYSAGTLTVQLNWRGKWEKCFSHQITIPRGARFAISASTGQLTESHLITGIRAYELPAMPATAFGQSTHSDDDIGFAKSSTGKSSGSWLGFLFKLCLFAGVCFGALKGWEQYKLKKDNDLYKLA